MAQSIAWPSLILQNYRRAFDETRLLVMHPGKDQSDEVTRALARFLVVRSCGYLEAVTEECVSAFVDSRSSPAVTRYAKSWLGRGRNPTPGNLVDLAGKFESEWANDLNSFFNADDKYIRRELWLMVDRRNKIAHGASENVTSRKSLAFAELAERTADWFVARFDPRK